MVSELKHIGVKLLFKALALYSFLLSFKCFHVGNREGLKSIIPISLNFMEIQYMYLHVQKLELLQ